MYTNENCRQIDLAEILEIKPITLARQIDLLEEAGLVRRNKDSEDRRAYGLALMPKAHAVMQALWEIADAVEAEVLKALTAQEQRQLTALLECNGQLKPDIFLSHFPIKFSLKIQRCLIT